MAAEIQPIDRDEQVERLIRDLADSRSGHEYRRAKNEFRSLPADVILDPLIARLRNAKNERAFDRTARMLAELGGDRAVEALAAEARTQRRYPRMAVRALSQCKHPMVVHHLVDLLAYGSRGKQRRAAARYLAKVGRWRAIQPLCSAIASSNPAVSPNAKEALKGMGRTDHVARMVFQDPEAAVNDRVDALEALSMAAWFNTERFLERESRRWLCPWKPQARETLEALRARKTLLRPAAATPGDQLLRAAAFHNSSGSEDLLRAVSAESEPHEPGVEQRSGGWLVSIVKSLRVRLP